MNFFRFLLFAFVINGIFYAQQLKFDFDYARFRATDSTTLCEFYYQFDKSTLKRGEENGVGIKLNFRLADSSKKIFIERKFAISDKYDTSAVSSAAVGKFDLALPFGNYALVLKVQDKNDSANAVTISDSIEVESFNSEKPVLSDLELAYKIEKTNDKSSPFYKNTYKIVPNPELIFTYLKPTVFYYYEIYGVTKSVSDSLILLTDLVDGNGEKVFSNKRIITENNNNVAKVGQISMAKLPTDSYVLQISIADLKGKYAYSTIKKFYFINPNVKKKERINFVAAADAEFGGLSETECDKLFREVQYLATKREKNLYGNLKSVEEKRRFLADFWRKRDRTPDTPRNEYMQEYFKRLDYVNKRFRTKTKEGYLTDRGRVYLLYGEPDEIDRYPYTLNTKPYELWYYHSIEGGVVFVFGDLTGVGDYVLLHSTKRGELYDSNWRERIRAF